MKSRQKVELFDRIKLMEEFNAAPDDAWFSQKTLAALRDCSEALIERDRWSGGGVPYIKCGRSVRYRKADIQSWLESHQAVTSTTAAKQ